MTTEGLLIWFACLLGAYVLGGIPFGLLIGLAKGVDIRQHGSKNIGTANVGRTLGRKWGALTFVLDCAKGFVPVFVAGFVLGTINRPDTPADRAWMWLAFGIAPVLGHLYSPFLRFRGGKGVATGFGALLAIFPIMTLPALMAIGMWALLVQTTRYIGLSSCIAALTLPLSAFFVIPLGDAIGLFPARDPAAGPGPTWPLWPYMTVAFMMALLVVWRHRSNLGRMLAGTEPRVKRKCDRLAEAKPVAAMNGEHAASPSPAGVAK